MKEPAVVDFIIVGQGLAGSALAMQMVKRGKKILVIDQRSANISSNVAPGLFNPITGKKALKTWFADEIFPYLHSFYDEVQRLTGKKFFFPLPLYRPFASVPEQNEWMGKSADDAYRSYIQSVSSSAVFKDDVNDRFGGLMLRQTGYLNTTIYLKAVRNYLESNGGVWNEEFDEDALVVGPDYLDYKGYRAGKIIFCQGGSGSGNRWFNKIPLRPLKGEIIRIKTEWQKDVILNRGVYMVPGEVPGEYRVGSTYNFNDSGGGITAMGRQELEEKLKGLIRFPYEVTGQEWGIRPTTPDRRPILGCHPEFEQLIIFNGLGTKGVSLAPYFSEVLFRWLENRGILNKEVDVTRYY